MGLASQGFSCLPGRHRCDTESGFVLQTHLVDANDPQRIVTHRSHNSCHKGPMPVLILDIPILPASREIRPVDVIYDPCSTSTLRIMHSQQQVSPEVSWMEAGWSHIRQQPQALTVHQASKILGA